MRNFTRATLAVAVMSVISPAAADQNATAELEAVREEIRALRQAYESRISELEGKLEQLESQPRNAGADAAPAAPARAPAGQHRRVYSNEFNPSIGVILNGRWSGFSESGSEIAGFGVGEEGERGREGLAVDESELNVAANVDDKFYGAMTAAIVREEGEDKVELEEAYVQTLGGAGLPTGLSLKAGRAFWTLGYLNEHHTHEDDFADRPLPSRVFLNNAFNDDGVEFSYVLPTALYSEIGGGVFRGDDLPFGDSTGSGPEAWSLYGRLGGDIGYNQSWRVGAYVLSGEAADRVTNEGDVGFAGDTDLYVADLRYTWAPTGNARQRELTLQGEYFRRSEDGSYRDATAGTGNVAVDDAVNGGYVQAVYKFRPQWRIGARYSLLQAPDVPAGLVGSALDGGGHDPEAYALMLDWTNSEFSRVRLQYNREELSEGLRDDQFIVQYIMSLGAHGAHKY
ncbi:uncharacterized protein FOKN1_0884 [Thiohalobacter thiocyanaticus]|uniref:Porin n=1 Tax=Thiohalobacter thiocyanaticus TaxID=585455 RepID=A0A1Z4VNS3_9GAMM|nr:hypothetical protein [Thiohalobacter thiocyanaticus]BAZ93286.1 uncharacterized protein FOKN1_0884 [Thiohalobacter thiocyanaticus]